MIKAGSSQAPERAPREEVGKAPTSRLSVTHVDPWSVAKVAFLLSTALCLAGIVATAIFWLLLDSMHVFAAVEDLFVSVGSESFGRLIDYLQFDRVLAVATIVGIIDIVLLTLLATLGAFLYNILAQLVGGVQVQLTED